MANADGGTAEGAEIAWMAGTSLDNVVTVRVYAVNSGFYNTINRVYAKYFNVNPPARSFLPVALWPMEFDIEIECVAVA